MVVWKDLEEVVEGKGGDGGYEGEVVEYGSGVRLWMYILRDVPSESVTNTFELAQGKRQNRSILIDIHVLLLTSNYTSFGLLGHGVCR